METHSEKKEQDHSGPDAFSSGALMESGLHRSGDRPYPPGMGLRPKACPRSRRETSSNTWNERPSQGQVDRCLTLVRVLDTNLRGNGSSGSGAQMESAMDAQGALTSHASVALQGMRPGQSPSRDRTQSWWDVLPVVPKCGKTCFMCGAPCNRTLGRHFIRLADDNPAHLCFHHDLHELYGE